MANIITTLHPENDESTNLYPNIVKENIPDGSIDMTKLDNDVKSLFNPSPTLHVDTSTNILAFTENKGVYIGSDTGNWYYWDGTQYVSGGVYQSTGIADGSITKSKIGTDLLKNILDENKLKDTIILNEENCITKVGVYLSIDNYQSSYSDYKCVLLNISNCDSLQFTSLQASGLDIVFYEKLDGTKGSISNASTGEKYLDLKDVVKIAINFFGNSFYSDFKIIKNRITLELDNKLIITKYNIPIKSGVYITIDNLQPSTNQHYVSYIYKCKNLKTIKFKGYGYSLNQVVWKDAYGNVHGSTNATTGIVRCDVSDAVEIAFNFFDGLEMSYEIEFTNEDLNAYNHFNNKGFIFNDTKSALFVGDSITAGFTSGSTQTSNTYPKLFSEHYGMTYWNEAVGGAEYCNDGTYNENIIPKMLTQITNSTHKNVDYLFIAGGVNDWQSQNSLSTFRTAVSNTIDYAIANYPNAQIILITPINACYSYNSGEKVNSLQIYRNIITEVAISKGSNRVSVIQGNLFDFPNKTNSSIFINSMFGDGLHPSELGYASAYLYGLIDSFK